MCKPIMAKATAVWLVDNTTLTFSQIAKFCGLHDLEVQGIADGEVAMGIKGFDPVANDQLDQDEITTGQQDPEHELRLKVNPAAEGEERRRGPRYTPLSKREDRPSAIAWLVKNHPEVSTSQITKLVGTTKKTIESIRDREHWNIANIVPADPVALGLCRQLELDEAVRVANERKAKKMEEVSTGSGKTIIPTKESLKADPSAKIPTAISGLESFTLNQKQ